MSKLDIAKSGFSIPSITDSRDFLFNQKSIFKIAFTGSLTVSVTYVNDGFGGTIGQATNSFQHSLGYIPISYVFSEDFGTKIPDFISIGAGISFEMNYRMDNDELYIEVIDTGVFGSTGDTVDFDFKYQIMYDKIF